jgi:GMP synthase (glutamine-hydrolysing)
VDTPAAELAPYSALIVSGGPDSVLEEGARQCDPEIFELGKPTLGICYGMQLMAFHLGGEVGDVGHREDGRVNTSLFTSRLFEGLDVNRDVWMSHGDSVILPPKGFDVTGGHEEIVASIADETRRLYGVQFHPEVDDTPEGDIMISNFLFKIAQLEHDFEPADQITEVISDIRREIGEKEAIVYLSGGVDSTVLALLVAEAITDKTKIHPVHVDNGFMRVDESTIVKKALESLGIELEVIDAAEVFLDATTVIDGVETDPLSLVVDPEIKRQIIGDTFVILKDRIIAEGGYAKDSILVHGTLRPDIIESGSHMAGTGLAVIKTHHNDSPAVRALRDKGVAIDPLKNLYKDQVREIGRRFGLPEEFVMRQPFPGPGLAIRIICSHGGIEQSEKTVTAQSDLDEYLLNHPDITGDVMPFQTVGVQGDGRSYTELAVIRSINGSASWHDLLEVAGEIPKNVKGVNRVAYAFRNTVPAKKATPTLLGTSTIEQLSHADAIVRSEFTNAGLDHQLSQVPVILAPISFGEDGGRSIAIRPFSTRDFMTGKPAVPGEDIPLDTLESTVERILNEVPGITQVLYDLSSKPPATTEWE